MFFITFLLIISFLSSKKIFLPPKVIELPYSSPTLSIFVGGDIYFEPNNLTGAYDSSCFAEITDIFKQSDFVTSNLETPICDKCKKAKAPKSFSYSMKSDSVNVLKNAGFDLMYLANNHMTDFRHEGMFETIQFLKNSGLEWIGAGKNEFEARRGYIIQKGKIKVGILNYMEFREEYQLKFSHFSAVNHSGVANFSQKNIEADVANLRNHGAQTVMVHIHWGENFMPINANQRIHAQMMSDAGVDVVVGTHPHSYQNLEKVGKSIVFYSIGNLVFHSHSPRRFAKYKKIGYAFPLTLHFDEKGLRVAEVWPLFVADKIIFKVPKKLEGKEGDDALNQFRKHIKLEGNEMEIVDNRGIIKF